LILRIAPAVAKAAAQSGVATRPIEDFDAYQQSLTRFVYQTGMLMKPVFGQAKANPKRVAMADGEDERALRAVQQALDEGIATPILIGRPGVIQTRVAKAGLRFVPGQDVEVVDPEDDPRFRAYWEHYHALMGRNGITPAMAKSAVRRSNTLIASIMVATGDADAMLCGLVGQYDMHLERIMSVIGKSKKSPTIAALNALVLGDRTLFVADTYVNEDPSAQQLADIASLAADELQRFGIPPKVAFLSHSSFGSSKRASAKKMRLARDLFSSMHPEVECDGEMTGDAALSQTIRDAYLPQSVLKDSANVLICPNLDAANILFSVLKVIAADGVTVGPILLGTDAPAHVLNPSATVRRVVNMLALASADASRA